MVKKEIRVLVVDDEVADDIRENLEDFTFHDYSLKIDIVESSEKAGEKISAIRKNKCFYDVMIVDMKMGSNRDSDEKGIGVLKMSTASLKIVLTGHANVENCLRSIKAGAFDYINKNSNTPYERLIRAIGDGLEERVNPPRDAQKEWLDKKISEQPDSFNMRFVALIDDVIVDADTDRGELEKRVTERYPFLKAFYSHVPVKI